MARRAAAKPKPTLDDNGLVVAGADAPAAAEAVPEGEAPADAEDAGEPAAEAAAEGADAQEVAADEAEVEAEEVELEDDTPSLAQPARLGFAKLVPPDPDATSLSWSGDTYVADADGFIIVPLQAVADLTSHGFTVAA